MAPYIHEIEVLLFEQRIECLAVLEQAVLVMTGRLPAVRVFRQCEAVGGTNHAGVADATQRQKPFDVFGQRAVGIAQAAYRIAGVFFQCSAVSQDFFGNFGQGTARDGRMRDRVAGDFMSAVEIRNLGRVNALVISEEAAVEMESAALYANAAAAGKKALTILTISDSLVEDKATSAEERQNAFTNMMKVAFSLI